MIYLFNANISKYLKQHRSTKWPEQPRTCFIVCP